MKEIKEHIKTGNFQKFYLLYGTESYLKNLYRDKLKQAILQGNDQMNFSYYEGKDIDIKNVISMAETLPFFADRRLILIENSKLFKNQSEIVDQLGKVPETTVMVFVEDEVDKRNRLYKYVKDHGTISEMNGLDEKNLQLFVVSQLDQEGKKITVNTLSYLLEKCGTDMMNIQNELQKLIAYSYGRDVITVEDIDAVVSVQITGHMFPMIDAIGSKQKEKALTLYYDLIALKEKPLSILYLIIRHFNILLQVKDLSNRGISANAMSEKIGVPSFAISKYVNQSRNFPSTKLKEYLEYGTELEEMVKTGRVDENIAVELAMLRFSS